MRLRRYWVRVTAPHFCAGIHIVDDQCVEAAPILKWCVAQPADWLASVFKRRGWTTVVLPE